MKKFLLTIAAAMTAFSAMAAQYNDKLTVTVKTESGATTSVQDATVEVETLSNGNIDFNLKNFILTSEDGGEIPVGNIAISGLPLTRGDNFSTFSCDDDIEIESGDDESQFWLGPMLGEVPLVMNGKMTDSKLYAVIDIEMLVNGEEQQIHVEFGTDFATAKSFVDNLSVSIDGNVSEQTSTVVVEFLTPQNGNPADVRNINFSLKNFILKDEGGSEIPVGNIAVRNLALQKPADTSYSTFAFEGDITIENGDDPDIMWMGPMLGEIPLDMNGKLEGDKLYVTIGIEFMDMNIDVVFGSDIENAISDIKVRNAGAGKVFDLTGRVARGTKGICIVNGKKSVR